MKRYTYAIYTHPLHPPVVIRLDGRDPKLWHGRGGWTFSGAR